MTTLPNAGPMRRSWPAERRPTIPLVVLAVLVVLAALAAACAPATPAASETASASAPASSPATSAAPAIPSIAPSTIATHPGSAAPSGACVDVADLADLGEPVVTAMIGIKPALDAQKVDDARALVDTATKGMTSMAELVGPASPAAKQQFLDAAAELTKAATEFPGGGSLVDQARVDRDEAFAVAQAARCSD